VALLRPGLKNLALITSHPKRKDKGKKANCALLGVRLFLSGRHESFNMYECEFFGIATEMPQPFDGFFRDGSF